MQVIRGLWEDYRVYCGKRVYCIVARRKQAPCAQGGEHADGEGSLRNLDSVPSSRTGIQVLCAGGRAGVSRVFGGLEGAIFTSWICFLHHDPVRAEKCWTTQLHISVQ